MKYVACINDKYYIDSSNGLTEDITKAELCLSEDLAKHRISSYTWYLADEIAAFTGMNPKEFADKCIKIVKYEEESGNIIREPINKMHGYFLRIEPYDDGNEPIVYIGRNNNNRSLKFLSHNLAEYFDKYVIEKYSFHNISEAIFYFSAYSYYIKEHINKVNQDIITTRHLSDNVSIVICTDNASEETVGAFNLKRWL